ncbi:MAG TPA: enoyl-CoA hydratase/isomerase family protein [Acidimicrobiia bacterium]
MGAQGDHTAAAPETSAIRIESDGPAGRITLARPAKRNALNRAALEELPRAAAWFDAQPAVKVVVVAGEGSAFSAGFDLGDATWTETGPPQQSARAGRAMAEAIGEMRATTIASIRGHCVGGAVVLASACDLRLASASAVFRIPEVDLGIPLFWTGVPRLVRELGPALTKELVITGRPFAAAEALEMRFVNRVVADDDLEAATGQLTREVASKPALVLRAMKQLVEAAVPAVPATDAGADADVALLAEAFADAECRAAAARYLAGRSQRA